MTWMACEFVNIRWVWKWLENSLLLFLKIIISKLGIHIRTRKALIEWSKLWSGEKTSYSTCLSTLIAVTLPEALPTRTDLWNIGESMIVYIGHWKKKIILVACKYWDSWKSNYFLASQYIELLRVVMFKVFPSSNCPYHGVKVTCFGKSVKVLTGEFSTFTIKIFANVTCLK